MWRWLGVVAVALVTVAAAVVVGFQLGSWQPDCPTEDSCQPVYEDGRWEIRQVIP